MENLTLMIFTGLSIPLAMILPVFKKQSRSVIAMFITGMFICAVSGDVNTIICQLGEFPKSFAVVNITPLVEEILKSLPVVFIAMVFDMDRQRLIESSLSLGVGFATLENVYMLFIGYSNISFGFVLLRAFGAGLMHSLCSMAVGYSLSFFDERKKLVFPYTMATLSLSAIYHSVFNILITSQSSIIGCIFPAITFIPIFIVMSKQKKYDSDSVNSIN